MRSRLVPVSGILILAGLLITGLSNSSDQRPFDVMNLIGEWSGAGKFAVPSTGLSVDIEGSAAFTYDSTHNRIRTAMQGEKFLLTYSDSGYLHYYPETDSVSWEIWDSWGRHAIYWGSVENDMLRADRLFKRQDYRVTVAFPHPDTLDFRLFMHESDGTVKDMATFLLWRREASAGDSTN